MPHLIACVTISPKLLLGDSRAAFCTAELVATSAIARVVVPTAEAISAVISQVAQTTFPVVSIVEVAKSIGASMTEQPGRTRPIGRMAIAVKWGDILIKMETGV